jgi:acetate kinase
MMGTRSGAIDPSVIEYVCEESGKSVVEVTSELNKKSGLLGVSGKSDSRDVELAAADGNEDAALALEMYNDRVAKYIVQYYIELEGKVDSIVFTAGVGENGRDARLEIMKRLAPLGIKVDAEVNDTIAGYKDISEGIISTDDSTVRVEVIPTNEEIMIIKDTYELVK